MTRQDMGSHTTALEDCRREFVASLPWLGLHLTRQSNQGSELQKEECVALTVTRIIEECPQTRLEGELKPLTGGVTT